MLLAVTEINSIINKYLMAGLIIDYRSADQLITLISLVLLARRSIIFLFLGS